MKIARLNVVQQKRGGERKRTGIEVVYRISKAYIPRKAIHWSDATAENGLRAVKEISRYMELNVSRYESPLHIGTACKQSLSYKRNRAIRK